MHSSLTRGRAFAVLAILCASASAAAPGMQKAAVHAPRLRTACVIVHHLRGGAPPIKRSPSQLEEFFKGIGDMLRAERIFNALDAGKPTIAEETIAEATQSIQALEEDVGRKEAEIASLQAAMEQSKQEASKYAKILEGEVESGKAAIEWAEENMQLGKHPVTIEWAEENIQLEEDVKRKEAEIASLQATMEQSKQEASEYATRLEGEVESGKATIAEVTQSMQALEEDVRRKETEIASLQAAMEKSKQEAKATIAEATQSIRALEEDVGRKETEIASLHAAMDRSKQEASEYAKRLEGEVESGKATIAEAMQSIRALEEDVGRKEAKIVSLLQAVMEKSKQEASK
jgi:chromosome segregation ATPase